MNGKAVAFALLAAVGASLFVAPDADARHRLKWREWRIDPDFGFYRPEPSYIPYPFYDFEDDDDDEDYGYEPGYYEPEYIPPPRKKRRSDYALQSPPPATASTASRQPTARARATPSRRRATARHSPSRSTL
jgi:hypothetical protein